MIQTPNLHFLIFRLTYFFCGQIHDTSCKCQDGGPCGWRRSSFLIFPTWCKLWWYGRFILDRYYPTKHFLLSSARYLAKANEAISLNGDYDHFGDVDASAEQQCYTNEYTSSWQEKDGPFGYLSSSYIKNGCSSKGSNRFAPACLRLRRKKWRHGGRQTLPSWKLWHSIQDG